jgi:hypothetical protein
MLPGEPLTASILIALTFGFLEWLTRIAVLSTGPPVTATRRGHLSEVRERGFRRFPKLAALKPLELGIRMPLLQTTERGQEIFLIGGAERGWQSAGQDRPVRVSGRHGLLLSKSLQFFDECRALDAKQFSSAVPVASGSIEASLDEVALDGSEVSRQIETIIGKFDERCLR